MPSSAVRVLALFVCLLGAPILAHAQATIAGVVKDASGAVLPGVTVEAASPALIEKVRSVVTDGEGQYRIVDLRPGAYTVTFTLAGFNTVKREGIELTGSFTATVDIDMRVGALEETILVTGEAPLVDVQSATRQQVLDRQVIDTIPAGRSPFSLGVLVPGVTLTSGNQDVGGSDLNATQGLAAHGGKFGDQVITQSGMPVTAQASSGWVSRVNVNMAAVQEVAVDFAAVSAEQATGGVRVDLIPRDGGNEFQGTLFANFTNDALQGDNLSDDLKARGLSTPDSNKAQWDINPGFGGPIKRDRLWFYGAARYAVAENYVAGMFYNQNANNLSAWTYVPDETRRGYNAQKIRDGSLRFAWQASQRNKIGVVWQEQKNCACFQIVSATVSPEADQRADFPVQRKIVGDWSSPLTSRLLLQAGAVYQYGESNRVPQPDLNLGAITVTEQSNGLRYRGPDPGLRLQDNLSNHYRFSIAYITGSHSYKVGSSLSTGYFHQTNYDVQPVSYRFNNAIPNQLTQRALPYEFRTDVDASVGLFAQDSWTIDRLTVGYGVRYDYFASSYPEHRLEPTVFTPGRNVTIPAMDNLSWHDVTPKLGATYDVFGTGRTAVRITLNKYLEQLAAGGGIPNARNPLNNIITSTTRSWTDGNRNFVPDCDLLVTGANGECGALANPNIGNVTSGATYNPDLLTGWGKRGFNWEFSAGIQHEIVPRVSVDVGFFRRWYGNFLVTDNLTVGPQDFDRFSITVPADPRLEGGGGYAVTGLYDLKPARFGLPTNNYVTLASDYGKQSEQWNGVDVSFNVRPRFGLLFQGGVSTGKTTTDNCEIAAAVPETLQGTAASGTGQFPVTANGMWTPDQFCHQESPFLTQIKGMASYRIPRIGVQTSVAFQSTQGPHIFANYTATNAVVSPSLGRNLSGNAANIPVLIVEPGSMYGERMNQIDLRFGKLITFGRTRSTFSIDLYNALNADTVLGLNSAFATWQRPTSILPARFAKFSVQLDF
jgi:hypothetical protein